LPGGSRGLGDVYKRQRQVHQRVQSGLQNTTNFFALKKN
jgi:hypothetical protein